MNGWNDYALGLLLVAAAGWLAAPWLPALAFGSLLCCLGAVAVTTGSAWHDYLDGR